MKVYSRSNYIKSPLNYIGGKQKILDQLLPLFPSKINQFVDLFAGGCNVGINVEAKKVYLNDNLNHLVEMYKLFQILDFQKILQHVELRIKEYELSINNEAGYKKIREFYNENKNPLDLFLLICYSFNHQIRFNNSQKFNNPFGKNRSSFNDSIKNNLKKFHQKLQQENFEFTCNSFEKFNFSILGKNDFLYCDPPYLITKGSYNDGKRGFKGWTTKEEKELLKLLDKIDASGIKFALSNVLEHKGKTNNILKDWLATNKHYKVTNIKKNYSNSNYQTIVKDVLGTVEVVVTNYDPTLEHKWIIQTQHHNEIYRK